MVELLKRPAGFLPPAISVALLVPLLLGIARGTLAREADEGILAHLFQILIPLIIACFAATWLPKRARAAAQVLSLQALAFFSVLSIVFLRNL
jgi:predicted Na+-dependent transporter